MTKLLKYHIEKKCSVILDLAMTLSISLEADHLGYTRLNSNETFCSVKVSRERIKKPVAGHICRRDA